MQTLHPRFGPWILGNASFASKVWALGFRQAEDPRMQTLHPRFGPWIFGQAEDPECKLCIQGLGLDFRQKTQNANFASKVRALNFRQAEDPECKLASKVWALKFRQAEGPECKLYIQSLGLEFQAGRRPRMQTLHPRFGLEFLGRQKTQNANCASKVWALDLRQAEDPECKLGIQGLGLEF